MSKKIGILTYHYAINDGAVLQAYALSKALSSYLPDYEVEIIDYRPLSVEMKNIKETLITKKPKTLIPKISRYLKFNEFVKSNLPLSKERIVSNDYRKVRQYLKGRYDIIVVGSDEIWKLEKGRFARPFPNIYWLPGNLGAKKIAFAASANKLFLEDLSENHKDWIKTCLINFSLIGVRDTHTLDLIRTLNFSNLSNITKIPDPTFLLELDHEDSFKQNLERFGVDFNKPRAGVLLTEKKARKEIGDYLKNNGYQVIALSYFNENADVNLFNRLNPLEWARSFKYFDFCVTDRFHGAIFCLKNSIPFVAIDDIYDYANYDSKIACLMEEFRLSNFYYDIMDDGFNILSFIKMFKSSKESFDPDMISKKLIEKKNEGLSFIDKFNRIR